MKMKLDEDDFFKIRLLRYDRADGQTERYYFSEMSTLQALRLLTPDQKIIPVEISVFTGQGQYVEEDHTASLKTVGEFFDFFLSHTDYQIQDCCLHIECGLVIESHDDGEVSFSFSDSGKGDELIGMLFQRYQLKDSLIGTMKRNPGRYLEIGSDGSLIRISDDFLD